MQAILTVGTRADVLVGFCSRNQIEYAQYKGLSKDMMTAGTECGRSLSVDHCQEH